MDFVALLDDTIALLDRDGWCQGGRRAQCRNCVVSAAVRSYLDPGADTATEDLACELLGDMLAAALGLDDHAAVLEWNDHRPAGHTKPVGKGRFEVWDRDYQQRIRPALVAARASLARQPELVPA